LAAGVVAEHNEQSRPTATEPEQPDDTVRLVWSNMISSTVDGETTTHVYNGDGLRMNKTANNLTTRYAYGYNTVQATYYYDAFGVHKEQTGTADNPYRYSGYTFDEESGLYYLKSIWR
jgi:hypothetical protein